jgi:rhodanese-related sulfurtransferase
MAAFATRPRLVLALVILLAGAAATIAITWPGADVADASRNGGGGAPLTHVSVADLHAARADGALVIDVREPHEYAEGRVPGSVLVPLATVSARAPEFATDDPVFVICRSGNRSLAAAEALVAAGFGDVRNVLGGMLAWEAEALPIER